MDNLQKKWEIIRDEGLKQIQKAPLLDITRSRDLDPNLQLSRYGWVRGWTGGVNWLNYGIAYNNKIMKVNGSHCPKTTRILRNLMKSRKVVMAGYSLLRPKSGIPKHTDQKDGIEYDVYHIGLSIPEQGKCLLGVGSVIHYHTDGELIKFDDRTEHWALNNTNGNRLILYIKCLRFPSINNSGNDNN